MFGGVFGGIDAIDWGSLTHAYGSAEDIPGLLRQAAVDELFSSIFHQGTVYPATVAAVPFLAQLAVGADADRDEFAWMLGMLADDRHAGGASFAQVREAVGAQSATLAALLDDADPKVREAAAHATAKAGVGAGPLWRRWAVEDEPAVRASLAVALGEADPGCARTVLAEAALDGGPQVRVAAAAALLRAGFDWPAGTIPALVAAIDADTSIEYAWAVGGDWSEEFVTAPSTAVAVAVTEEMLRSRQPGTRRAGLWALSVRCDALRSAPPVFVPLVAPLLDDPDPDVRGAVLDVLRRAGAAAGPFADAVAAAASRYPDTAGAPGFTVEYRAVETLQRLGDPRWVGAVCAAPALRHPAGGVRFTPEVVTAVRARLAADPASAVVLAELIGAGDAGDAVTAASTVAGLVPQLLATMDVAGPQVAAALLRIRRDEPVAVPYWRTRARTGDLEAALAVRRLTGDTRAVLDALHAVLDGDAWAPWLPPSDLDRLGEELSPVLPAAIACLTAEQHDKRILAARVVAAAAGPAGALPTVEAVLVAGGTPARHAADLVADLALTSRAAVAHVAPLLRDRLGDRWSRLSAARALARLGVPMAELVEPLTRGVADYHGRFALGIIVELRAVETVPVLEALLGHDERAGVSGLADDIVWADEVFQERLRDTIRRLNRL